MSNGLLFLAIFVVVPAIICGVVGAIHGRRGATRIGLLLGALAVSGITCWSLAIGGHGGTDMPFFVILPSWFVSPFGPFVGASVEIQPSWWLTPWLPFVVYLGAARYSHDVRASRVPTQQ